MSKDLITGAEALMRSLEHGLLVWDVRKVIEASGRRDNHKAAR